MSKNRFEQVDEIQPDAVALTLAKVESGDVGTVILPASAAGGRLTDDQVSAALPAMEAFRSAVRLANEMKVAMVVIDPAGAWKAEWGQLYRPIDD